MQTRSNSKPRLLCQVLEQEIDGVRCEPFELVDVELPEEYSGSVIDMLGQRKGTMLEMGSVSAEGIISLQYEARGLACAARRRISYRLRLARPCSRIVVYAPKLELVWTPPRDLDCSQCLFHCWVGALPCYGGCQNSPNVGYSRSRCHDDDFRWLQTVGRRL